MPKDKKPTTEEITDGIKAGLKEPNEKLVSVIKELNKTTESKLGELAKKQTGTLGGFIKEQSPLLDKTFKFFKGDKKRERLKAMVSAKTMGPVMAKGLSLGLLKFGIGGALGAAKIIDVAESFQDYTKQADADKHEKALDLIDELRTGESPKSMEQIEGILKEQGHGDLARHDIMKAYNTTLDERMKDIVIQGIESGKDTQSILKDLVESGGVDKQDIQKQENIKNKLAKTKKAQIPVSKTEEKVSGTLEKLTNITGITNEEHKQKLIEIANAIDKNKLEIVGVQEYLDLMVDTQKNNNEISLERATTDKKRLEFEKQVEQNEQLRHSERMDLERDKEDKGGGIFGGLLAGLIGLRGAFTAGLGALTTGATAMGGVATALAPVLAVAGTAFLAFKAGGLINDGINKMVNFVSGKEGETLGGILADSLAGVTDRERKEEEAKGGRYSRAVQKDLSVLMKGYGVRSKSALEKKFKERGYEGPLTTEAVSEFEAKQRKKQLEVRERVSNKKEIEKAEANKLKAAKEAKEKELSVFERYSDEDAINLLTQKIMDEINKGGAGGGGATAPASRLDKIPSNSDDLQLAYMSKGDSS